MHEESGWQQKAFYLDRKWWRWWRYYDEDEVLSSVEPLYPTNSRMAFSETNVVIVYDVFKTRRDFKQV